ncbi:unnamed protein product [Arabidopsis halleri]
MLKCLVECGFEKVLKLAVECEVEYLVEWNGGGYSTMYSSMR